LGLRLDQLVPHKGQTSWLLFWIFFGEALKISDIDTPLFTVGCETDHIAPWKDSFYGIKQMESRSKTFVLSQ
jgi:poly(3-hydroxyalkanoate) synthetase